MQGEFGAQGKTATENYLARALAFDPTQAINTYAKGAWGGPNMLGRYFRVGVKVDM